MFTKQDVYARFSAKVSIIASTGCHEWQSTLHRDGYGKFYYEGDQVQAHRVAYMLFVGEIPAGKMILHRCDNRRCVNPQHLYTGTAKQNVADKVARSKWYGSMRFKAGAIDECRRLYALGAMSQQEIADKLNMDQTSVSRFVRGKYRPRIH